MARTGVKICCIQNLSEAALAVRHGASALGLVSEMPSGPGVISEEEISEIAAAVPPGVASVLLTSRRSVSSIVGQVRRCRVDAVQICDRLEEGSPGDLRRALPGVSILQVIHVTGHEAVGEARAVAAELDGILLDSGDRRASVRQLGGTGRTHDWELSRRIRRRVGVPVFLAGGLRPDNVVRAIQLVRPFAVDVCTGVRTLGVLDEAKLEAFFRQVRIADRTPP